MKNLLVQAAEAYGFETVDSMLEHTVMDSVAPGICKCGFITEVEPDGIGWCEDCEKASCKSVLLLAHLI
jgi:hypothetical protein